MVSGSLKSERGRLRIGETKTKRTRAAELPSRVLSTLKAHSIRQKEEQLKVGSAWRNKGLVFTTEVGTPIDRANVRRMTTAVCEDAGVDPVSPNELGRHTAASLLYDSGMSLGDIADLLGHKSRRMLEAHYKHPVRATFSGHVDHVDAMFGAG
jgi:integrase